MGLRKVSGDLIRKVRSDRTMDDVIQRAKENGHTFSEASLSAWENEKWKPTDSNILALCAALGCTYEEISIPVQLPAPA